MVKPLQCQPTSLARKKSTQRGNMKKLLTTITLLSLLNGQVVLAAATESARCAAANDSLDIPQASSRTEWAFKCYPGLRGSMPGKQVVLKDTQTGATFPGYPTFALIDENNGNIISYWAGPTDANASCDDALKYSFIGFCRAGCYTPDQAILFSQGFISIADAKNKLRDDLMTVSKDSSLDNLNFSLSQLDSYTVDPIAKKQKILVIQTQDGGELKITLNHPMLDSEGVMRSANSLSVGEKLVKMDGSLDRITSIKEIDYIGKVFNVHPTSADPSENIVVAQGYLSGSVYFQNEGIKEINRMALRSGNVVPNSLVQ